MILQIGKGRARMSRTKNDRRVVILDERVRLLRNELIMAYHLLVAHEREIKYLRGVCTKQEACLDEREGELDDIEDGLEGNL